MRAIIKIFCLVLLLCVAFLIFLALPPADRSEVPPLTESPYGVGDGEFFRTMGLLLGPALLPGNRIDSLRNGDEIFPAMLSAIRAAQHSITFENYKITPGKISEEFSTALIARAQNGVKVHMIIDWVGSHKLDEAYIARLRQAGVEVEQYHPPPWWTFWRLNNRTHRKILVVDGEVGFTGGAGISDEWSGHAESPEHWRDTQFRLTGPAVAQLQSVFEENWIQSRETLLHGNDYFPALQEKGNAHAQVLRSSSEHGSRSMRLVYLLSIAAARKQILIANAYFVPDNGLVATLVAARKRGVEIEIIVPGPHVDYPMTRRASRSRWGDLLEAGVKIYEYQPTMFHCKVMVVDGTWVLIGSTNFDNRSFRLNGEVNLNVWNKEFAARQIQDFQIDKAKGRQITYAQWKNRSLLYKAAEQVASLFREQL